MKTKISLDGYSGYRVELLTNGNGVSVVRKSSRVPSQNQRLKQQYLKHRYFSDLNCREFSTPSVIGSGYTNELFYYEYEYVEGVTFLHYITTQPLEKIIQLLDKIMATLDYLKHTTVSFEHPPTTTFKQALVEKALVNCRKLQLPEKFTSDYLRKFSLLSDSRTISLCHGDFSFDNIIVDSRQQLWLIDFLDLFYPHYWLDISKLFQDIDGGWFEIKHHLTLPSNALVTVRDVLWNRIFRLDPAYLDHHYLLLSLAFMRILPYTTSQEDRERIFAKIDYFSNKK